MSMFCNKYLDNVVWEITLKCNAHCVHCGSAAGRDRPNNLTQEEIFRVCDELEEIGCRKVNLIGGEMFLHPLWKEIIISLRQKNIDVSIITNAICLNKEKIEFLDKQGVSTIGISLDGATPEMHDKIRQVPGTYKHVFSLMKDLKNTKINLVAITTLNRFNILQLKHFADILPASFFHAWQLQIGAPFGRMAEDLSLNEMEYYVAGIFVACLQKKMAQSNFRVFGMHDFGYYSKLIPHEVNIYKKNWEGCPAGKHLLGLRSDGKVYGCLSAYDDKFIEGDIREKSLAEIWNSETLCSWNQRFNKHSALEGYCAECPYNISCCAGCTDIAFSYSGNVGNNPLCYHAIEQKYEKYSADDEYGNILKSLVNGEIMDDGTFLLENKEQISENYINSVKDNRIAELLKIFL